MTHATRTTAHRALSILGAVALLLAFASPAAADSGTAAAAATGAARSAPGATTTVTSEVAAQPDVTLSLPVFRSGLSQPVLATNAGDGTNRVYVVEKAGRIKVLSASGGYLGTLLNITDRTSKGGEQGLLGLAFHPNYESNLQVLRLLHGPCAGDERIVEYRSSSNGLATVGGRGLLFDPGPVLQPQRRDDGVRQDGFLYIGTGDGGSAGDPGNRAQSLNSLLGRYPHRREHAHGDASVQHRARTRTSAGPASTESSRAASATRGDGRSSTSPVTSGSAMSDRASYEEINKYPWTGNGPGRGPTTAGARLEALPPIQRMLLQPDT